MNVDIETSVNIDIEIMCDKCGSMLVIRNTSYDADNQTLFTLVYEHNCRGDKCDI